MNNIDINLFKSLTFEYNAIHRNIGLFGLEEPYITEHNGYIKKINIETNEYPDIIGMFSLISINYGFAKKWDEDKEIDDAIDFYSEQSDTLFFNIKTLINDKNLNVKNYKKIIILRDVILHPNYRAKGVLEELFKSIYINFADEKVCVIAIVKPLQASKFDFDIYTEDRTIEIYQKVKGTDYSETVDVPVNEYFGFKKIPKDSDDLYFFKLYGRAQKLGMNRFKNTDFFYYTNFGAYTSFIENWTYKCYENAE